MTAQYRLIALFSLAFAGLYNAVFFKQFARVYPFGVDTLSFYGAIFGLIWAAHALVLGVLSSRYSLKPLLVLFALTGGACAYFMATYGVVIDAAMIDNLAATDGAEAAGLMSLKMLAYNLGLGALPAWFIVTRTIRFQPALIELRAKVLFTALTLAVAGLSISSHSADFASFFREHKTVRYYTNPIGPLYAGVAWARDQSIRPRGSLIASAVSTDAVIDEHAEHSEDRELIVMIVGETARADHFELNGYGRATNPRLSGRDDLVSFHQVSSCGTSTAVSVPCMFSPDTRSEFDGESIYLRENALDVLTRLGVNVLWRDNNSSSKGVAERVRYEDFRSPARNPVCDPECRDVGMLDGLDRFVDEHPTGDILIVLHQMGNHGPEYFKRYPAAFEHFTPTCQTNQLGDCSTEEIINAYDNALRYTDHFIAESIDWLEGYPRFETALLYVSDHGESLGENGLYLHGMPYAFAPESQTQVPAVLWTGASYDVQARDLVAAAAAEHAHDEVYCTLLTLFEAATNECGRGLLSP